MSQLTRVRSGHLARRFSPVFCILLVATSARGFAQSTAATPPRAQSSVSVPAQGDKVDEYIEAEMRKQEIPSLSLAVVQNGKVVKSKAYGLANMEWKVPATTNTVYQIQSITKSFIACGIMLLVEDGKLALDDKITKYLSGMPQAWSQVTIRQMMTHTSGIPSFVQDQGSGAAIVAFAQKTDSSEQIIRWAAARPLKFAPGEGRKYSSTGYHLLGMIIEKVSGKPWGQFLHDRIFAPLGMSSTRVFSHFDIIPNRASGYNHFGDVPVNGLTFTPAIMESAAGGLLSSVEDMSKWEIALERGIILKPSTLAQMAVPVKLKNDSTVQEADGTRHSLGWDLLTWQGHRVMAHGGDHVTGFTAIFARFIDDKVGVIILTNLMPLDIGTLTKRVAGFYIPALSPTTTGQP
ncbi:MAG TPA: serine hydrolase domain-containing protein [Gemmatimonadaceae bacterium]